MGGRAPERSEVAPVTAARVGLAALVLALASSAAEPAVAQRELRVPGRPVVVLGAELPPTHPFGDRIRAMLTIGVNPVLADPDSVSAEVRFPPYRIVEAAGPAREESGGRVVLRYAFSLECLERDCLPSDDAIEFPPALVEYTARAGVDAEPLSVEWPEVAVVSRLTERDLEQPELRASAPAVEREGAGVLAWTLAAAALVVLAGGVALALLLARRAPERAPVVVSRAGASPLEAAFAVLERPAARSAEERRVALDVLARSLERSGRYELAARARRLAWHPVPPPPHAVEELVAAVRREAA
jgi:hypothetical protein